MKTIRRSGVRLAHGLASVLLATTVVGSMPGSATRAATRAPPLGGRGRQARNRAARAPSGSSTATRGPWRSSTRTDGTVLETLVVGAGAHDVCISERAGKAYITAETINMVTAVDIETLATESIPVEPPAPPLRAEPRRADPLRHPGIAQHGRRGPSIRGHRYDDQLRQLRDDQQQSRRTIPRTSTRRSTARRVYVAHDVGDAVSRVDTRPADLELRSRPRSRGRRKRSPPGSATGCGCRRAATGR